MMGLRTGMRSTFAFRSWDTPGVMIGRLSERLGDMQDLSKRILVMTRVHRTTPQPHLSVHDNKSADLLPTSPSHVQAAAAH
jgi:hypothetical protein